jgi:HAD superfamily hydrolase (TIGR01509 family)
MIKLIVFDLDGVLVNSKETHYEALNRALAQVGDEFIISKDDHLKHFDGLPTKRKLDKLSEERGLPVDSHDLVWQRKQECTIDVIKSVVKENEDLISLFQMLEQKGLKIFVASNSIKKTTKLFLLKLGLIEYIDEIISNEDVRSPKPHPEIYQKAMLTVGVTPKETMIVEDSHVGITAAIQSGGNLCRVDNVEDVTKEKINRHLNKYNKLDKTIFKWRGNNMNILIPMAGAGSRFADVGYTFPKPLIEVNGKPMIQVVVENINIDAHYIYVVRKEHLEQYNLKYLLNMITPNCDVVVTDGLTEGAACTTLLAQEYFDKDEPLLIANSDQYVEWDSSEFMYTMTAGNSDGGVLTFPNTHPKWSYAKLDEEDNITEIAEKKVISNIATVGVYYWSKGSDYVKYANQMIEKDVRVNNEFYVAPVYNEAIQDGLKFKTHDVEKMWGLGTPEDLNYFLENHK